MKKNWRLLGLGLVLTLLSLNIFLFSQSIVIGDNVAKLEKDIHQMKISNMELQQQLYTVNSLENISKLADALGFTKDAQPVNLHSFTYALAQ
ncbi:MAG TPA: hypothetical protein VK338_04770 [Candidatus Nitrosocosmicus sp.]|nr:hypothetical protein [Candidatus Nitrosocosmicus sp.]